jgi:uroporphyrinogen-III synthase
MKRLIVLRPEPGASETVERARLRGLDTLAIPLFEVEPVAWNPPERSAFDALLLTSANALRHGGDGLMALRGLPVHAVGDATAEAARHAGFDIASTGEAGVERLLGSIEPDLALLHLCGEDVKPTQAPQHTITRVPVYRSVPIEAPDLAPARGAVVLVHSPRAGARLAGLLDDRSQTTVAAISAVAAESVGSGWARIEGADKPTDDAMLALAAQLCDSSAP